MSDRLNKGGRPVGSTQTTRSILQQELRETARLTKRMRGMFERFLDKIEANGLSDTASERSMLAGCETLGAQLNTMSVQIERMGKHLIASEESGEADDSGTIAGIRRELEGRK